MVFGILIDVPLLTGTFLLMAFYRRRLTSEIVKVGLPLMVLYALVSIPLTIFEEQIDCMSSWCGRVIIPPTLPFILIEIVVLGVIATLVHARSLRKVVLVFSIYGIIFEILLGGLRGAPLPIVALLAPYVGLGYAFISMLPLNILLNGRPTGTPEGLSSGAARDVAGSVPP